VQEAQFGRGIDDAQAIRLGDLRGDLGEVLGARHPDRDRQPELVAHAPAHGLRDDRGGAKQMLGPGHVGESLVDRDALDQRRVVVEDADRGVAEARIVLVVAGNEDELRAKLLRLPAGHAAAHAEGLGLVRCREYHAAADRDRLAAQMRIEELLHRGIEGIEIGMQDRRVHRRTPRARRRT
jgi:hypothetical protein